MSTRLWMKNVFNSKRVTFYSYSFKIHLDGGMESVMEREVLSLSPWPEFNQELESLVSPPSFLSHLHCCMYCLGMHSNTTRLSSSVSHTLDYLYPFLFFIFSIPYSTWKGWFPSNFVLSIKQRLKDGAQESSQSVSFSSSWINFIISFPGPTFLFYFQSLHFLLDSDSDSTIFLQKKK